MAVLLHLVVAPASQEQCDELDARVGQSIEQAGGPPSGLMSHVAYPEGDGFVVADVWRAKTDAQHFLDGVLQPLLAELGLGVDESSVRPVWSFARP